MKEKTAQIANRLRKLDELLEDYIADLDDTARTVEETREVLRVAEDRLRLLEEEVAALHALRQRLDPGGEQDRPHGHKSGARTPIPFDLAPRLTDAKGGEMTEDQPKIPRARTEEAVSAVMNSDLGPMNATQVHREAQKIEPRISYSSVNSVLIDGHKNGLYVRQGRNYSRENQEQDNGRKGGSAEEEPKAISLIPTLWPLDEEDIRNGRRDGDAVPDLSAASSLPQ